MDIVKRLRDLDKPLTDKVRKEAADIIEALQDEDEAQKRADEKSEAGLEGEMNDAKRYRYLRDQVRKGGVIDEKLYVRCDGRVDGKWALDGEELDRVLDALIINIPAAPEAEKAEVVEGEAEKVA
jgi:hypothetical protein